MPDKHDLMSLRNTPVFDRHRKLFDFAKRVLEYYQKFKERVTNGGFVRDPAKNYQWYFLTNGTQIELNFVSACRLLSEGHVVECFILLRTSSECLIYIAYMAKDPQNRGQDWEDFHVIYGIMSLMRALRVNRIEGRDFQTQLTKLYAERKSAIDKFTRPKHLETTNLLLRRYYPNWTRLRSIRDIAMSANQADLYDTFYEAFTQYVHPTPEISNRYVRFAEDGSLMGLGPFLGASDKEVAKVISAGAFSVIRLVELLAQHFEIILTDEHSHLANELNGVLEPFIIDP